MLSTPPFRVFYPGGGKMFLLHWWTEDDRGKIVLARTERAMRQTARRVFDDNIDAKILAHCEIDVVAASPQICALAAFHERRERVDLFHREVATHLRLAVEEDGRALPAIFALCTNYKAREEPDDETGSAQEWGRTTHFDCRHCMEKIQLVGLTPDQLYDRYHEGWITIHPRPKSNEERVPSRATPATDGEPLWYACAHIGPHSSGLVLEQVDIDDGEAQRPHCISDHVMFFFRRLRDISQDALQGDLDDARAQYRERRTLREEKRRDDRKRDERAKLDAVLALFGGSA